MAKKELQSNLYDLSHQTLRRFPRREGIAVFTRMNPNGEHQDVSKNEIIYNDGVYTFFDKFEEDPQASYKTIGDVAKYNPDGSVEYKPVTVNPITTINIWSDYKTYIFLCLHNDNGSNPFRDTKRQPQFWLKPAQAIAKAEQTIADDFTLVIGLLAEFKAAKDDAKIKLISNALANKQSDYKIDRGDTISTHYSNLLNYARKNPQAVYRAIDDNRGQIKQAIYDGMTFNILAYNSNDRSWIFPEYEDSFLDLKVDVDVNHIEALIDHFVKTPKAYSKLKELIGFAE